MDVSKVGIQGERERLWARGGEAVFLKAKSEMENQKCGLFRRPGAANTCVQQLSLDPQLSGWVVTHSHHIIAEVMFCYVNRVLSSPTDHLWL